MTMTAEVPGQVPWWKEPTKDQWFAWIAAWPARSRGLMSGLLQGSWSIGFLLSSLAYGLLYDKIGWRGLLILGVLPALAVVWIRIYVKEPKVWLENRRMQREQKQEFRAP